MIRNIDPVKDRYNLPSRHLPLDVTFNLRDLGGYATLDNRQTRWHTLWRSDSLHRLNRDGQEVLLCLGLRTIIDLRSASEIVQAPNVFANSSLVSYYHIPLIPSTPPEGTRLPQDPLELYTGILDHCQPAVKAVFDVLLGATNRPCLVHCTAGKDRTGIVTALTLGAVGVPDETIIADYALTELYIRDLVSELRRNAGQIGLDTTFYERMLVCRPELMARTLNYLHQRYSGAAAYLRTVGLTDAQLEHLHRMLVE